MLYMLGNMTLSTTDPSVAQLIGWTSSWLKAEAGFVEAVRGLQDTPQLGEQLQDVLEALSWLGAGSIDDQQAKQFLSDMQVGAIERGAGTFRFHLTVSLTCLASAGYPGL